jgi:hypothetical protein
VKRATGVDNLVFPFEMSCELGLFATWSGVGMVNMTVLSSKMA